MKHWYDADPPRWAWLLLVVWIAIAITLDACTRQAPMRGWTPEPPLAAALDPEPPDPDGRALWIERIVERRLSRVLDADPNAVGGPVTDVLVAKLAGFIWKVVKLALEAAVSLAVIAFLWSHWPWIVGWSLGHVGLSWLAGRFAGKKP